MPDISVGSQIFDLVFHPSHSTAYTALLSGKVKAYSYDQEGNSKQTVSVKISQKSCRGITIDEDGGRLYTVGKGKGLQCVQPLYIPYDLANLICFFPMLTVLSIPPQAN